MRIFSKQVRSMLLAYFLFTAGILAAQPKITSFSPVSGPVGTPVTITGTNFSPTAAGNTVFFGAVKAIVQSATATQLVVTAPAGQDFRPISVLVAGLTAYSAPFLVTFPNGGAIYSKSFAPRMDIPQPYVAIEAGLGDLDGDGKPDLVVTTDVNLSIGIRRNTSTSGSVSFADPIYLYTGDSPERVLITDINGDGKPEIITTNLYSDSVSVFNNNSSSGVITASSFSNRVAFSTGAGSRPFGLDVSDIDGDGKPEIVATADFGSSLFIFANTSAQGSLSVTSFAPAMIISTLANPNQVAIRDLDGDGKSDLAVSYNGANKVSLFKNNSTTGSITLGTRIDLAIIGQLSGEINVADLDGDKKPELITAGFQDTYDGFVLIYKNNASTGILDNSSFASPVSFPTAGLTSGLLVNDYDGDGRPDIALAQESTRDLFVYRNITTTGVINAQAFTARVNFGTASVAFGMATGDVDGDGKPDLIAPGLGTTSILRNQSGEVPLGPPAITSFTPASGEIGSSVTITGINFDKTPANNLVYFGATQATVTSATTTALTVTSKFGNTFAPLSATVDGLTAFSATPFMSTFTGGGKIDAGSFASHIDLITGDDPKSLVIGDLNSDGLPDIATANNLAGSVSVFKNSTSTANVSFEPKADFITLVDVPGNVDQDPYSYNFPFQLRLSDMDGDGKLDLAIDMSDGDASSFANTGQGSSIQFTEVVNYGLSSAPDRISPGDLNSDGKPDMLGISGTDLNILTLINHTTSGIDSAIYGSFDPMTPITVADKPLDITAADLDDDGKMDFAVSTAGNYVSVFLNTTFNGNISFAPGVNFPTGNTPVVIATADMNGDHLPDLVTANLDDNTVSIHLNSSSAGKLSFAAKLDVTSGQDPTDLAIGDLDGDGRNDIVTVGSNSDNVSVMRNSSVTSAAVAFAPPVDFATGSTPVGVAIGDVTNDGLPDLVTVNNSGSVSVLKNMISNPLVIKEDLVVYHGLSPNGDHQNESWRISNIEDAATVQNHVTIYNRWGDNVFETTNYNNQTNAFTGHGKNGNELPNGTYFYRIEFTSGKKTLSGYLSLKK